MKLSRLVLAYISAIFIQAVLFLLAFSRDEPNKYAFGSYQLLLIVVVLVIVAAPFIVMGIIGNKNGTILKAISESFIVWVYISLVPFTLAKFFGSVTQNKIYLPIFFILEFLIAINLISRYKLPRAFIFLSFFIGALSNLYLLFLGFKQREKS